jgi:sugar/nucleoside kinase (ribokinase family)
MKKRIDQALELISKLAGSIDEKQVTVGFDGCCDVIYRVLKSVNSCDSGREFFSTIEEFGDYIMNKSGMSCSLELNKQVEKIGGNSPIFSNALGHLGIKTNSIGTLGYPDIRDTFRKMSPNCNLFSYAKANDTIALEFNDGKVMLSPRINMEEDVWEKITDVIGKAKLQELLFNVDMIGLVNWSELEYSTYLWNKLYDEISIQVVKEKKQIMFIDLSDCSHKDVQSLKDIVQLIKNFRKFFKVVLSLNENEALILTRAFGLKEETELADVCKSLCTIIETDIVVIHTVKKSYVCSSSGISSSMETYYNSSPQISTGAGDNFNAGFALGCLLELPADVCEVLGNASASYYLTYGHSPSIEYLTKHMKSWTEVLK